LSYSSSSTYSLKKGVNTKDAGIIDS